MSIRWQEFKNRWSKIKLNFKFNKFFQLVHTNSKPALAITPKRKTKKKIQFESKKLVFSTRE